MHSLVQVEKRAGVLNDVRLRTAAEMREKVARCNNLRSKIFSTAKQLECEIGAQHVIDFLKALLELFVYVPCLKSIETFKGLCQAEKLRFYEHGTFSEHPKQGPLDRALLLRN